MLLTVKKLTRNVGRIGRMGGGGVVVFLSVVAEIKTARKWFIFSDL
jgi:predicted transport protein